MEPPIFPDPHPPGVFVFYGGRPWLNGQVVEPGDSVFDPKFGWDDEPAPAVQVDLPRPGLPDRLAGHADVALALAAAALAALLWRRKR